jgi:hypothetical protein
MPELPQVQPDGKRAMPEPLLPRGEMKTKLRLLLKRLYVFFYLPLFRKKYGFNNKLGLYINAACNLSCDNCQVSARQAPSGDAMTIPQIKKIVGDAMALGFLWDEIFVTGGEPTLHAQFFDVLAAIKPYVEFHPKCVVTLETAGAGKKVNAILEKVPAWVRIRNSSKSEGNTNYGFVAYNDAPKDHAKYKLLADFSRGCRRLTDAYGLCGSMYGYYPCSPCMNVDRVFGFDVGIKKLEDVTEESLRTQMETLCKHCGWFQEEKISQQQTEQKLSKSWKAAFERYRTRRPSLSRLPPEGISA